MADLSRIQALTFDCYGTLVDWESGIFGAIAPILGRHGVVSSRDELLERYGRLESAVQEGRSMPYRDVLAEVVRGFGEELGFEPSEVEAASLAESLRRWPVFPDTTEALRRLGSRYRLAIVSNIDDDLFAQTAGALAIDFAEVVTAQQVGSYKPDPGHFHVVRERLGLRVGEVLHVAQSLFHDIAPAAALGWPTVWVDRRQGAAGSGATPPSDAEPDFTVPDLASVVTLLESERQDGA
jgi:2-haloacid dehalogenase